MSPKRSSVPTRSSAARPSRGGGGAQRLRAGNTGGAEDHGTRQRVIDAAIECILEKGFYRASSNAIAESAGLSWGVIQYYFGSRESLMLAVLEEGTHQLGEELAKADITGDTLAERLDQYFAVLASYYGQQEYLALTQILLNLSHDPRTSDQAMATMKSCQAFIDNEVTRLTNRLFAGTGVRRAALRSFPFHAMRGLALNDVMMKTLPDDDDGPRQSISDKRRLLAKATALLIESEMSATEKGAGRRTP